MLKIIKNPDKEMYETVKAAVEANKHCCPCRIEPTPCPCSYFRDQTTEGECSCGMYIKVEVPE